MQIANGKSNYQATVQMVALKSGTIAGERGIIHVNPKSKREGQAFPQVSEADAAALEKRKLAVAVTNEERMVELLEERGDDFAKQLERLLTLGEMREEVAKGLAGMRATRKYKAARAADKPVPGAADKRGSKGPKAPVVAAAADGEGGGEGDGTDPEPAPGA